MHTEWESALRDVSVKHGTMRLRPAAPDDAMGVAYVHVRSWQSSYRGLLPDGYLDNMQPQERAARYGFGATDPLKPSTVVAEIGDSIIGFATIAPAIDSALAGYAELCALYVDPNHLRRGVGTALLADACARMANLSFTRGALWLLKGNASAEHFYRRAGWSSLARSRRAVVWGIAVEEVCLERPLA